MVRIKEITLRTVDALYAWTVGFLDRYAPRTTMSQDVLPSIDVDILCSMDHILILYCPFILGFVNNVFVRIFDPANYIGQMSWRYFMSEDNVAYIISPFFGRSSFNSNR